MTATTALPLASFPPRSPRVTAAAAEARRRQFQRRRLVVALAAVVVVAVAVMSLWGTGVQADDGSSPVTLPKSYVVAPGDTLWTIAESLAPDADPRPIVQRLEASAGGATIEVGQQLLIPGDLVSG